MEMILKSSKPLALVLLAACSQLSLNASADTPRKAGPANATEASTGRSSTGNAHDRFTVLDLKIGMGIGAKSDFKCATDTDSDRHCVKFLDPRCANQPTNIGTLKYGEKAPLGCFLDYSNSATYLDSTLQQTPNTGDSTDKRPVRKPLMNVHIVGARTASPKIYSINYMTAKDELTEDSKLYRAMVAKYGEPSYKNPPNEMRWKDDNTEMRANCDNVSCEIVVKDSAFEDVERRRQEEIDSKQRHENATSPNL